MIDHPFDDGKGAAFRSRLSQPVFGPDPHPVEAQLGGATAVLGGVVPRLEALGSRIDEKE